MDADKLKEQRKKYSLSQAKLSELTGISPYKISAYELGKTIISSNDSLILNTLFIKEQSKIADITGRTKRYVKTSAEPEFTDKPRLKSLPSVTSNNPLYIEELNNLFSMHQNQKKNFSAISLFSGIGGLCLGFSSEGVKVKGFVEVDMQLSNIYQFNFPNSVSLGQDISVITNKEIEEYHHIHGQVDFLIGGPPCQGFSLAGKRDNDDPRNLLFKDYFRFLNIFNPRIAVLENVVSLLSMKNQAGELFKNLIQIGFEQAGYNASILKINMKNFGIPQHRERIFFIAIRRDITSVFNEIDFKEKYSSNILRTFADACSDLPYLESGDKSFNDDYHFAIKHPQHVINWLRDVPEGRSAHDNIDSSLRPKSGFNTTYKRQIWNEPAATVSTNFNMISGSRNVHPFATRSLTIREAARIQTFPDSMFLGNNLPAIRKGIGNAVPPLFAKKLANYLISLIL